MRRPNKRRYDRLQSSKPVALRWRDESGETRFEHGTVLDYTEHGLRIELMARIEFPTYVVVGALGKNKKACAGKIRYCLTKHTGYVVGLEFGDEAQSACPDPSRPAISDVIQNPQFSMLMFRR